MLNSLSLPDTKLTENIIQQVFGCDTPCDLAEVVEGLADVHGEEVIADAIF